MEVVSSSLLQIKEHPLVCLRHLLTYSFFLVVGCTVLKQLIMTLRGIFKPGENPLHYSIHVKYYATLLSKVVNPSERERKLKEYFKFMFLRDPMERLLSGYIDKVSSCGMYLFL